MKCRKRLAKIILSTFILSGISLSSQQVSEAVKYRESVKQYIHEEVISLHTKKRRTITPEILTEKLNKIFGRKITNSKNSEVCKAIKEISDICNLSVMKKSELRTGLETRRLSFHSKSESVPVSLDDLNSLIETKLRTIITLLSHKLEKLSRNPKEQERREFLEDLVYAISQLFMYKGDLPSSYSDSDLHGELEKITYWELNGEPRIQDYFPDSINYFSGDSIILREKYQEDLALYHEIFGCEEAD